VQDEVVDLLGWQQLAMASLATLSAAATT